MQIDSSIAAVVTGGASGLGRASAQALAAAGVKVAKVETEQKEPLYKFQPNHPHAIQEGKWKGYVAYPNLNMTEEFVDALEATRSYEANIGVMEISKNMSQQTLRILG